MRLNFLCPPQRDALISDPASARQLWLVKLELLESIPAEPSPYRVSLAGSALEAATIYLHARPPRTAELLERYTRTALLLVDMLVSLGQSRLAIVVIAVANALLEHVALEGADAGHAASACRRLCQAGFTRLRSVPLPALRASDGARRRADGRLANA
ncbi:MAG: hypothetical protein V2I82_06405 [Halieaceae bacterium]|jgi:hypothetical protein|nr:hypothetical protein [Halieaceae bacterium]